MNIVYLVFGDAIAYHLQTYFSILTFLRGKASDDTIYVITTSPQFYERLKGYVTVVPITSQTIDEWQGEHKFFWRAKIKALQYIVESHPSHDLLYLDGDTCLKDGGLEAIKSILREGKGMMHLDEGHPSGMKSKSLRMWKRVEGRTYDGIQIGRQHNMWNAGVVALPWEKAKETVQLALNICDGMLRDEAERVVIEQYSLSIALYEKTGLAEAKPWIAHYWGNKGQWISNIRDLMLKSYLQANTVEQDMEQLSSFPFETIPLHIHQSSTKRRLVRLLDNIFKDKVNR